MWEVKLYFYPSAGEHFFKMQSTSYRPREKSKKKKNAAARNGRSGRGQQTVSSKTTLVTYRKRDGSVEILLAVLLLFLLISVPLIGVFISSDKCEKHARLLMAQQSVCVFFTLNRSFYRRHPAHSVSVPILPPREIDTRSAHSKRGCIHCHII